MSAADEAWNAARMEAMAAYLDAGAARMMLGIETFIDTTPALPCGCREGMCGGHQPLFAFGLTAAEIVVAPERHEIRERDGVRQHLVNGAPACTCGRPSWADDRDPHASTCPAGAKRDAEPSGRPEKEGKPPPGIPLWDEATHAALAEMSGPMTLGEDKLPSYGAVPPGCCTGCHLPVRAGMTTCAYCDLAQRELAVTPVAEGVLAATTPLQPGCDCSVCRSHRDKDAAIAARRGQHLRARIRSSTADRSTRPFVLLAAGIALFCIAVYAWAGLVFPAMVFIGLGIEGIRRRR